MIRNTFLSLLILSTALCSIHVYAGGTQPAASSTQLTAQKLVHIQNECPICMEKFDTKSHKKLTPFNCKVIKHKICSLCWTQMQASHNLVCPECRADKK